MLAHMLPPYGLIQVQTHTQSFKDLEVGSNSSLVQSFHVSDNMLQMSSAENGYLMSV